MSLDCTGLVWKTDTRRFKMYAKELTAPAENFNLMLKFVIFFCRTILNKINTAATQYFFSFSSGIENMETMLQVLY